jgi:predicted GNAT family acetyltransferase
VLVAAIEVTDNRAESRYEARVDGRLAGFAAYRLGTGEHDGEIVFPHTEIDSAFGGQGVGSALIRAALDDVARRGGLRVRPDCPFVAGWLDKHPDYAHLRNDPAPG